MKNIFKFTNSIILTLIVLVAFLIPVTVQADSNSSICQGIGAANGTSGCGSKTQSSSSLDNTITYVVDILSIIGGIMAVFMIIFAGFRFVTSGGESAGVAGAKNTLLYAVVGIVVIAIAQIIVHFVLHHIP